jgi:hypothetical protein
MTVCIGQLHAQNALGNQKNLLVRDSLDFKKANTGVCIQ